MATVDFLVAFLAAIAAGALVGLERERRRDNTLVIAGVRTFPLISASGYLTAHLANASGEPLLVAVGVAAIGVVAVAFMVVRHQLGETGATTPMAMVVTFLIGMLIGYGFLREAVVVAVVTTLLLLTKQRLHRFAEVLDYDEMMSAVQFITVAFILFPLVADLDGPVPGTRGLVGPGRLFDPQWVLVLVIFVSSISFASFIGMRMIGPHRGVEASGLLGGLVNSEATAVSLASLAEAKKALVPAAVVGTLLATTTMFVRNLAIAAFADPSLRLARLMLPALVAMTVLGAGFTWASRKAPRPPVTEAVRVDSPFAIWPALKFAALFAVVSAGATLAQRFLGDVGVYAAALGGFVSAGAVIASVATLYDVGQVGLAVAVETAILATVIGAFNKLIVLRATSASVFDRAERPFWTLTVVGVVALLGTAAWLRFF